MQSNFTKTNVGWDNVVRQISGSLISGGVMRSNVTLRRVMSSSAKSSSATSGIAMLSNMMSGNVVQNNVTKSKLRSVMSGGATAVSTLSRKVMSDGGMSGSMKFRAR